MPNGNNFVSVDPRELLKKNDADLRAALEAMLPKPAYPEHMLGLWAQHPEYGSVLVIHDHPDEDGEVLVSMRMAKHSGGAAWKAVHVSELTFQHQVTRPEDVPEGEAWIVDVNGEHVTALKVDQDCWSTGYPDDGEYTWHDDDVTLIAPLTPGTNTATSPEYVETEEEYEALPKGAIVADDMGFPLIKRDMEAWYEPGSTRAYSNVDMSYSRRRVLRRGWRHE